MYDNGKMRNFESRPEMEVGGETVMEGNEFNQDIL
jgi:hypothetical protein